MSFKEFLEENGEKLCPQCDGLSVHVEDLFVFLWERGGKQFALRHDNGTEKKFYLTKSQAFTITHTKRGYYTFVAREAQDFLDCVAIDEERVKQKIKELEKQK